MEKFDYVKPEMTEFAISEAKGESCYIDCTSDDICPSSVDTI